MSMLVVSWSVAPIFIGASDLFLLGSSWIQKGVSENVVYPCVPNGFADHYPY